MAEGLDKFGEVFKGALVAFHGIIATWLFLEFSETPIDEFYFVILLIFFTVVNILIWRAMLWIRGIRHQPPIASTPHITYRGVDVVGLTLVALVVGLTAAYLHRKDVALRMANLVVDWQRTGTDAPFSYMMSHIARHTTGVFDKRDPESVAAAGGEAYVRVYIKEPSIAYEGYPGVSPSKLEAHEVVLTPACRVAFDASDSTKLISMQRIDGPGVYLNLTDIAVIEILDARQSECRKLQPQ